MTKTEAYAELERLREKWCTCGSESLLVTDHKKCPYRIRALRATEVREHIDIGALYSVGDPVAA